MAGLVHGVPGSDFLTGTLALSVFGLGAVLAVIALIGVVAFRRAGAAGPFGAMSRVVLMLVGAIIAWALLDRFASQEHAADRRAFDARTAELTARAIVPGSALACLDAVASGPIESACEKALFATPEATAAAIAYVDARFSLLSSGIALAARDPGYEPTVQRLRRAIETDRYGFVAHVLTTRGCNSSDCPDLKLLRDPARVLANMKSRSFDAQVALHNVGWHSPTTSLAAPTPVSSAPEHAPIPPDQSATATPPGATSHLPLASRYDFPSSASIPPVSIMNAEPPLPAEPRAAAPAAPPPRQSTPAQPRRQTSRDTPRESAPPHQPLSVLPDGNASSPSQAPASR
jgi:hypothetical protein